MPASVSEISDPAQHPPSPASAGRLLPLRKFCRRHRRFLGAAAGVCLALAAIWQYAARPPAMRQITQGDIDAAVLHTLKTRSLPSPAARAYEVIGPSVVRVRGLELDPAETKKPKKAWAPGSSSSTGGSSSPTCTRSRAPDW
jgi:hypothetical protein